MQSVKAANVVAGNDQSARNGLPIIENQALNQKDQKKKVQELD